MSVIKAIWQWLVSWFADSDTVWRVRLVEDNPVNHDARCIYLIREGDAVWQVELKCPFGCAARIQLLDSSVRCLAPTSRGCRGVPGPVLRRLHLTAC